MRSSRAGLEMVQRSAEPQAGASVLDPDYLFRSHARYVAAIAHRLLGREHDVDDTVQEVFLSRHPRSLRNPRSSGRTRLAGARDGARRATRSARDACATCSV